MIDVLRRYTPSLLSRVPLAAQAKNVLSRVLLCRTATLKGRVYQCPQCHSECNVYNSCVDRHWAMHILPKGYTRSRSYGGYHGTKRSAYLACCRELLGLTLDDSARAGDEREAWEPSQPTCPHCDIPMECIGQQRRSSWREVFERGIYADPAIYSPMHHIHLRVSTANPNDEYG